MNPANIAAQEALDKLFTALANRENFIFEAGAGAGKTYSLVKALQYLIERDGRMLAKQHKRIACITFTNVAKAQIEQRTDRHPVVHTDTIHAFCWSLIKNFQVELRKALPLNDKWQERLTEFHKKQFAVTSVDGIDTSSKPAEPVAVDFQIAIGKKEVSYQLGFAAIKDEGITLGHDDVLNLMVHLLNKEKFRNVLLAQYPVLLIDEYQDTHTAVAEALLTHFIKPCTGPQIGFFGDHWQKIYGSGCGQIQSDKLLFIPKNANFRSVSTIVKVLNGMRPELKQEVEDPESVGTAAVFHTNEWAGERMTGGHWAGDLPSAQAHDYLVELRRHLEASGWDFAPDKTKILMLTHSVLAQEQGYKELSDVFQYNESLLKKEDKFIAYFNDFLEPICDAFERKKYGEMFTIIGGGKNGINSHTDKVEWNDRMSKLATIRKEGSIGDVLDFLIGAKKPKLTESITESCLRVANFKDGEEGEVPPDIFKLRELRQIPYSQVIAARKFVEDHTPFATKHSVKGEEYDNVLVVVGRGWSQYNFDQMLNWFTAGIPKNKWETFERSRNLFYVCLSRPKTNLAVLFTQELSAPAQTTLESWFGKDNLKSMGAVPAILN